MKKILFIILSSLVFAQGSLDEINSKVERINKGIVKNNLKIKTLTSQARRIQAKIRALDRDLDKITKEKRAIGFEIRKVSRKIGYGRSNLRISDKELAIAKENYNKKIIAWQRASLVSKGIATKNNFKMALENDLNRISYIEDIKKNIVEVKSEIEKEKKNLSSLRRKLLLKEREFIKKENEQKRLVAQLKRETTKTRRNNESLKRQKSRLEKEIDKIISERTKQVGFVGFKTVLRKLGGFVQPVVGKVVLGYNEKKTGKIRSSGQEIKTDLGNRVKSANRGKVIYSGIFMNLGKVVMVDHGYNLISIYGNMISTYVKLGDRIKKGQKLGVVGLSTNGDPNLYFEVRFNRKTTDPNVFY